MARKLSHTSWADIEKEMSIAGEPAKIVQVGKDVYDLVTSRINTKNIPEITNMQFALQKVIASLKVWERMERDRQSIKL